MTPVIAWFPGQGSQHVGMGRDLLENFALARQCFEEASDAIRFDLRKLCLEGPADELTKTENTQPALLTVSVAAFRVAQAETGFQPGAAAGHSLGEYSALVAAEAFPLHEAVRWVRERGAAMQRAVPLGEGTMAAVMGLDDTQVEALCQKATEAARAARASLNPAPSVEPLVQPANFNAPGQVVIAGSVDGIAHALQLAKSDAEFAGAKTIPLSVSAPFHCALMAPARARMAQVFAAAGNAAKPQRLAFPYVPNRTGRISREPGLVMELLVEQIDHPVLWRTSVLHLLEAGYRKAVEFGPGKVLANLAKRIPSPEGATLQTLGVSDAATLKTLEAFQK